MKGYRALWLRLNFLKECFACLFDEISHSQARTGGTLRDPRVHKPQIHRSWGDLHALRTKLNRYTTNLGPVTEAVLEKETDSGKWYTRGDREDMTSILAAAVQKANKYLDLLVFAKSACNNVLTSQRKSIIACLLGRCKG